MTLRRKIMLAIILLVIIPITALGIVSYYFYSEATQRKSSEYYGISLIELDRKLKYALTEINTVSDIGIVRPAVQQLLRVRAANITVPAANEINNLFMTNYNITSLSLYSNTSLVHSTMHHERRLSLNELRNLSWYSTMESQLGRHFWLGPNENPMLENQPLQLTHARIILDFDTLDVLGTLVLTVKSDVLEQVFWEAATVESGNILLANQWGQILYSKTGEDIGKQVEFPFLNNHTHNNSYVDTYNDEQTLINYIRSHNEGWYLIAVTPMEDLRAESAKLRNVTFGLLLLSLVSVILFDMFFTSKLVKQIIRVVHGMKRVEQGNFAEVEFPVSRSKDESSMLVDGFNQMSTQIHELIEEVENEQNLKKQAEMQALVSQINPHFIYNSLESINSLAVIHGNKEISKMVTALGKLLRISISESDEFIPIGVEIEHVKNYLMIQKFRFGDKFDFNIEISEQAKMYLTQRLIVQPIVENALYHGIEKISDSGTINIRVILQENFLVIEVSDNGPGFDIASLENLFSDDPPRSEYVDGGVGLKNVSERLRIRFGSPFGMMVCSSPDEGTVIRLRIPKITTLQKKYNLT